MRRFRLGVALALSACAGMSKTPSAPTTSAPPIETPPPAPPPDPPEVAAPWTGPRLRVADANAIVAEWKKAKNKATCAALAFVDAGAEVAQAKPRKATFVGGWAIAWDKKGLPGTDARGNPCAACGRSAFGIAGTGADATTAPIAGFPERMQFSDGSTAAYGPQTAPAGKQAYLAYLTVNGQQCLYNVWTELGKDHLEMLLKNLRFVAGAP